MRPRRNPRAPAAWPGRSSIAIALGALVAATTVWWLTAHDPLQAAGARVAAPVPAAPAVPRVTSAPRAPVLPAQLPPVAPYPRRPTAGVATDDPLTAYRKANVYPPTSRPLTEDQLDLLAPNRRHEVVKADDHGAGITYLFTADRYFVIGEETLTATLVVRRDGRAIPTTITRSFATVLDPKDPTPHPIPLVFAPTGTAGLIQATVFAPARLGLARQSAIGVYIEFDHGKGRQGAHFDFQYTPERGIPARFTGAFRESIESGSLVIRAGVEVVAAGPYVIDCNLYDAANLPVAWTRFKGELTAGVQEVELLFFGKVILDGKAQGTFHIGQLRGARYALGLDPDLEQMPPFAGTYTTRPYAADVFSDAEYDSPQKQKMIELLGQQQGGPHGGGAGSARGSDDAPSR